MDIKEKMQTVLDVIGGKQHPSVLRDILPAPGEVEENFIRLAVDFLVARERERAGGPAANMFRLKITESIEVHEGEDVQVKDETSHFTEWQPERTQISVPTTMAQIRQRYPRAAITVERNYEQVH